MRRFAHSRTVNSIEWACPPDESKGVHLRPVCKEKAHRRAMRAFQFLGDACDFVAEVLPLSSNCCRERQCAPDSESNARYCDTRTTLRMSHAHTTYVLSRMVEAASSTYVGL